MNRIMMVPITFAVRISTTPVPKDIRVLLEASQRNHARVGVPGTPGTLSSLEANHMIYPQNPRTANHVTSAMSPPAQRVFSTNTRSTCLDWLT